MSERRCWTKALTTIGAGSLFAFACSQAGSEATAPIGEDAGAPATTSLPTECPVAPVPDSGATVIVGPDGGGALGGKLMIVGGALNDSSPIWQRTIDEGGGKENLHFLVVTAAITASVGNYFYYQDVLS